MKPLKNEDFKKLANQIMFDLSDEEIKQLQDEFQILFKQVDLLNQIDTEGIEEMVYPFDDETTYLREDEIVNVLSQEDALANVAEKQNGYVCVPKVVK